MQIGEKYFLTVVEEQSISKAAQKLFITQQSLSEQMQKLEKTYGARLFLRKPKFRLTLEGEALLSTLQRIHVLESGLDARLLEMKNMRVGRLNVGIHATRASVILPEVIPRFRAEYPNVALNFYNHETIDLEQMLLRGDLDLFFGINAHPLPEFQMMRIASEKTYIVASASYLERVLGKKASEITGIRKRDLPKMELLLSPPSYNFRRRVDQYLEGVPIPPEHIITIYDYQLQIELAGRDVGVCFCPQQLLRSIILPLKERSGKKLLCFPVAGIADANELSIVTHRQAYQSEYMKKFLSILLDECRRSLSDQPNIEI